ncbi:MAG: dTDP-4-dehydrorhamnose 3,5-epimerase family protein [Candidatus Micrarchaeota archaeon]|nr:dTDP-4-dehydrorhamnose 3,5-epimerase family protein [Candidatus Micrarchaeota archaeon]
MIDGVLIVPLKQIPDERGKIMHMIRKDSPYFEKFGEVYFSVVYPGVVKGWHTHTKVTLNYAVPFGTVKLVLYDMRENSKTKGEIMEIFTGESNYVLIKIPPGVASGVKGVGVNPAFIVNCATEPHDPKEIGRIDPFKNDIPYDWKIKEC